MYAPNEYQQAALSTSRSGTRALEGLIPGQASIVPAGTIQAVSEAVGRDITPYRADGTLNRERFPNGVNLAPYLRSVLKRWAAVQK